MARPIELTDAITERVASRVKSGAPGETATQCEGFNRATHYAWLKRGGRDFDAGDDTVYSRFYDAVTRANACALTSVSAALFAKVGEDPKAAIEFLKRRDQRNWDPPKLDPMTFAREQTEQAAAMGDADGERALLLSRIAILDAQRTPRNGDE